MNTLITSLVIIAFIIFQGFFRRTFGGWRDKYGILKWIDKYISIRFICEILEVLAVGCFSYFITGFDWLSSIAIALIIVIAYWLPGHGPWFDLGRGGYPDEKMLKRYDKVWWNKWMKKCFKEEYWYGDFFDFIGLSLRYTLPCLLLVPFYGGSIMLMGIAASIVYGICRVVCEKEDINNPTEWSEIILGCVTGICFACETVWFNIGQYIINLFN